MSAFVCVSHFHRPVWCQYTSTAFLSLSDRLHIYVSLCLLLINFIDDPYFLLKFFIASNCQLKLEVQLLIPWNYCSNRTCLLDRFCEHMHWLSLLHMFNVDRCNRGGTWQPKTTGIHRVVRLQVWDEEIEKEWRGVGGGNRADRVGCGVQLSDATFRCITGGKAWFLSAHWN